VIELGAHIARLAASVSELFGTRLAPTVAQRAEAEAAAFGPGRGRLRIDADGDGAVEVRVSAAPAAPGEPVRLVPFVLPGGLGAHKWRDRHLLEVLSARARGGVPLLVDTDGVVLEAAYANVWIRVRDGLRTPPADGRILPGVTRAALLASDPTAREDTITLERLESAEAVFLTSSIAGHHPARLAPPGRSSNEARGAGRSCSTAP
jgi:para-aminobenzoate synthetase/4-amino-4-deoxychorismate lyase